jgi:hypothetical protein
MALESSVLSLLVWQAFMFKVNETQHTALHKLPKASLCIFLLSDWCFVFESKYFFSLSFQRASTFSVNDEVLELIRFFFGVNIDQASPQNNHTTSATDPNIKILVQEICTENGRP